ncbi:hypothetical protein KC332_g1267 [Hortaea werneckii]|nr:hypothetical protein KC358_g10445 [Hortaea werneckii]KAI6851896.1 hypothetical protein KC350_g1404 [Hortaea werneckii]KAI6943587.1 hypothetical protein KC341_g1397 [Hortaea werneckii]KAI6951102.1 hypothetical protein KC348_g286 [Hortaea werneckii]KAI6981616.1 hypothetical protein KC321_g1122 [Hortaea werneckii]
MSGIEIAGLVLGAFPLMVTAMEHYQETAKAAGTFWRIRTVYRKDYRSVTFCQTKLKLHMEELLGPLVSVDITDNLDLCLELLQRPGGDGWIDTSSRNPLEARLRHCYAPYQDTMEELHLLMEKLNKDFKTQNALFGKLVLEKDPASPRDDFRTRVRTLAKDAAFQDAASSASLRIALQQSEDATQAGGFRDEHKLHIKHVDEPMPVRIGAASCSAVLPNIQLLTCNDDLLHGAKHMKLQNPPTVTFSQPLGNHEAVANLMQEGLCKTLSSNATTSTCFGYLHDEHDDVQYRIYSDSENDQGSRGSVTVSTALKSDFRPPFYRTLRYGLALKLAIAQLKFHPSPWMPKAWLLDEISLSHGNSPAGIVDFETPHVIAGLDNQAKTSDGHSPRDETFWSLGIVLLELCFGKRLETHDLWSSSFARNPLDPFQRLAIAQEWARDVELEADTDFAEAVPWCLQRAPIDASRNEWRKEFVQSVIHPLERCCKSMAPRKVGISPGSSAAAV